MTTPEAMRKECARRIIQRELGRTVLVHDDGSRPRMYDLRVGDVHRPDIAIECVGAVDPVRAETWNVGPGRGSFTLPVEGDWHIILRPGAPVKRIRAQLADLLEACKEAGIHGLTQVDAFLRIRDPVLFQWLHELKIKSIGRYTPGTGKIYLGMTGIGGPVDPTGRAVPRWIGEFLRAEDRRDVLMKLRDSGAKECHAFIFVSFGGVPWPVESYLGTRTELLPQQAPDLPEPIDAVWIMYGTRGVWWDGRSWRFFSAMEPVVSA